MAASDHLGPQFGNTRDPQGSSYSPKHSEWSMEGGSGSHGKAGRSGRAPDKGFYSPQHTSPDAGYVGKHASDRKSRIGAVLKGARKMIRGHA